MELISNTHLCPTVLEAGKSKTMTPADFVFGESPLNGELSFSLYLLHVVEGALLGQFSKGTNLTHEDSAFIS